MVAVSSGLISSHPATAVLDRPPVACTGALALPDTHQSLRLRLLTALDQPLSLPLLAAALVVLPVFAQAPWVRSAPMAAALFSSVILTAGLLLERQAQRPLAELGVLLVGFSGSWLGGSLFWGWCRLHPLWHLPIEAFALPLAVAGLSGRWRLAGCFYLASLLGTAATDGAMAISGVIDLWPQVLSAPLSEAPRLLQQAAMAVVQPLPLTVVLLAAAALLTLSQALWRQGTPGRVAAATLATTVVVDGLFLAIALAAPALTGLL